MHSICLDINIIYEVIALMSVAPTWHYTVITALLTIFRFTLRLHDYFVTIIVYF